MLKENLELLQQWHWVTEALAFPISVAANVSYQNRSIELIMRSQRHGATTRFVQFYILTAPSLICITFISPPSSPPQVTLHLSHTPLRLLIIPQRPIDLRTITRRPRRVHRHTPPLLRSPVNLHNVSFSSHHLKFTSPAHPEKGTRRKT
jgi:hypothetical protein